MKEMTKGKQMILEQPDGEHQVLGASRSFLGLGVDSDRIHEIIRPVFEPMGDRIVLFFGL